MSSAVTQPTRNLPRAPWGYLPPRMHILFITGPQRTGGWLAGAFQGDIATQLVIEEAQGMAAGLARLRDEVFDAVLVSHEGPRLDALELLDAIRAGASEDQSVVVVGDESEQALSALCFEAGADAYVCVRTATTRALLWTLARAMERRRLIADHRRLESAHRRQVQVESEEARRLLAEQASIASRREAAEEEASGAAAFRPSGGEMSLPDPLLAHYRDLLRAYVIMGSGNLSGELARLAESLVAAGVAPRQTLQMHVRVLDEAIQGLGCRSARHVVARADLLILELMLNLAEGYRRRFLDQLHPPRQLLLPGFDGPAGAAA